MNTQSKGATISILNTWRETLNSFSAEERKILVLNADYVKSIEQESESFYRRVMDLTDLLHVPFTFSRNNRTVHLETQVQSGLQWQREAGDPWVMWTIHQMQSIDRVQLAAVQLYLLSIPGTPCIVAGQEIERVSAQSPFF